MSGTERPTRGEQGAGGEAPDELLESLLGLRARLLRAGYDTGFQRILEAQRLLVMLAAEGKLPRERSDWKEWLAPLFCSSSEEQVAFDHHFAEWLRSDPFGISPPVDPQPGSLVPPNPPASGRGPTPSSRPSVVDRLRPLVSGDVRRLLVENALLLAEILSFGGITWWVLRGTRAATLRWWEMLVLLLPLLGWGGWQVATWRLRKPWLQRLTSRAEPTMRELLVDARDWQLFNSAQDRQRMIELRRPRTVDWEDLDVPSTVHETARQAGHLAPRYRVRRSTPEYLLLIDRWNPRDELTYVADQLWERMREYDVYVEAFYFQRDARICHSAGEALSTPWRLAELAARYPEHRLLIFSDGDGFFDPYSGRPQDWLREFSHWEHPILLTPRQREEWSEQEAWLTGHEYVVIPATTDGLGEMTHWMATGQQVPPVLPVRPPFPEWLDQHPAEWVQRHPPPVSEVERMLENVRTYLGEDDWVWLSACAVYPELTRELTVYLGTSLYGAQESWRNEWGQRLYRLIRLPWYRYRFMPDWFRWRLIDQLDRQTAQRIRQIFDALWTSAFESPKRPLSLRYAIPQRMTFRSWLRQWGRSLAFRRADLQSPLCDIVFLQFLHGLPRSPLAMRLPERLRQLLYDAGQPAFGLRPVLTLLLAVLLTMAGITSPSIAVPVYLLALLAGLVISIGFWLNLRSRSLPLTDSSTPSGVRRPTSGTIEPIRDDRDAGVPTKADLPPASAPSRRMQFTSTGAIVDLGSGVTLELVSLPGGSFLMGSEKGHSDEKPVHEVTVAPFLVGRTQVTQAQWRAVMGDIPKVGFPGDDRPVESINWREAKDFCDQLAELTGFPFRLPTEAEWEYAARGGTTTEYSFGDDPADLDRYAWYAANSNGQTHPVGQKLPNPFGLYDMHGNVWEWVEDHWHNSYEGAPTDGSAWLTEDDSAPRVLRGGSWYVNYYFLRSALRNINNPDLRNNTYGFRVVVGAQTQSKK
jgi:formylglycine-generating enzyme required for sulfatase activity